MIFVFFSIEKNRIPLTEPHLSHLTRRTPPKSNLYLANSLDGAVKEPVLYRLLTFKVPNLISLFRCVGPTRISVQVRGFLCKLFVTWYFYGEEFNNSPNPQAGGPSLVGCPRLLIEYTFHIWGRSPIRNPRTRPAVVIGSHLSRKLKFKLKKKYFNLIHLPCIDQIHIIHKTNKMLWIFMTYFIHNILTNMFRPLLPPSSGWCYYYKNIKVQM